MTECTNGCGRTIFILQQTVLVEETAAKTEGVVTAQAISRDLKVQFSGVKTLDGRALKDHEFCFVLSDLTNTSAVDIVSWNDKDKKGSKIAQVIELSDTDYVLLSEEDVEKELDKDALQAD